jgi:hypothetical protein
MTFRTLVALAALLAVTRSADAQPSVTPPAAACTSSHGLYNEISLGFGTSDARTYVSHATPDMITVARAAAGMVLRGCSPRGLEVRIGLAAQGTRPDHTYGGGIGAEVEGDVPVGSDLAIGLRLAAGAGNATWATAGVRLRHRYFSLGVDGLYSSGVLGRYVDDPQELTRAPVRGAMGVAGVQLVGKPKYYLIGGGVAAVVLGALVLYGLSQMR